MNNILWRNKLTNRVTFTYMVDDTVSVQDEAQKLLSEVSWAEEYELIGYNLSTEADYRWGDAFIWNATTQDVEISLDFAKEVRKDELRQQRDPVMKQLDIDFMRALEMGDTATTQAVAAEKQRLRDITLVVDACTTLEELDAVTI